MSEKINVLLIEPGKYPKQIEIEDAIMASEITELLMGTDVPPRKAYIYEHATDAELDLV